MLMNLMPTCDGIDDHPPVLSAPRSHILGLSHLGWQRVACHFLTCLDVARQRRQLLALNERALKDGGISGADAVREAHRGFWDIPEHLKLHRSVHPAGKAETTG